MISRLLTRAQVIWKLGPVPAQGTLKALALPAAHQLKNTLVHQKLVRSGTLLLNV